MRKKTSFIILMLILSGLVVLPAPMVKADGSVDAQEVNAEFYMVVSPPAYDGVGDTRNNLEDDFRGAPLDLSLIHI